MNRSLCPHCRKRLPPGERIHEACIEPYAQACEDKAKRKEAKKAKEAAKAERAEIRQRKKALKPRAKLLAECQAVVNKYVRLRDKDRPCCSCERPASWTGQWHASHYRSVGAASAVRFNLWNIHKSCSICNNYLSGNIAGYRPRIIERIGLERLEWLDGQNQLIRYSVEYLQRLKKVMGKRLKRLESRL